MNNIIKLSIFFAALLIGGCATPDYSKMKPNLDIREVFNGELHAIGMVQNRSGGISQRFKVNLTGSWNEQGVGTLYEIFRYDDGSESERTWTFTPDGNNGWIAQANDTLGPAKFIQQGPTIQLLYQMNIDVDGTTYKLSFDDWLYAIDRDHIMNRSTITKFGFRVAEVTLVIQRGHIDLNFNNE